MFLNLVLVFLGSWTYADMIADPPVVPTVHAVRPVDVVKAPAPAILPATAAPASTLAYWPPGTPRHLPCQCGGGGCNCSEAGKCTVIDSDCEPGLRRVPTASIAPLIRNDEQVGPKQRYLPPLVTSTVAAPGVTVVDQTPILWQLKDRRGVMWRHRNKAYLESFIADRNVVIAPPIVTYTAPPVTYYSPPIYQAAPSFGFGFSAGVSRCGPGGCR